MKERHASLTILWKVLQERTREFKYIFSDTQDILKHLFGMEMVELPAREKPVVAGGRKGNSTRTGKERKKQADGWTRSG